MNHDQLTKNYYMYRDPGRGEWFRLPWDVDQAFPVGVYINTDQFRSPLYGDAAHPQGTGSINPIYRNRLHQAVLDDPRLRELYLRRLRTWRTPSSRRVRLFRGLGRRGQALLADEAAADRAAWAAKGVTLSALAAGVAEILETSLQARRDHLFSLYANLVPPRSRRYRDPVRRRRTESGERQPGRRIHRIPNPNAFAVDLSGWRLEGGVGFNSRRGRLSQPPMSPTPGAGSCCVRGRHRSAPAPPRLPAGRGGSCSATSRGTSRTSRNCSRSSMPQEPRSPRSPPQTWRATTSASSFSAKSCITRSRTAMPNSSSCATLAIR
ncbi:MAG: CotH kinase family protein [Verrucomicrobiales bacterium]